MTQQYNNNDNDFCYNKKVVQRQSLTNEAVFCVDDAGYLLKVGHPLRLVYSVSITHTLTYLSFLPYQHYTIQSTLSLSTNHVSPRATH